MVVALGQTRIRAGLVLALFASGGVGCGAFGSMREQQEQLAAAREEIKANRLEVAAVHLERAIAANPGDARGHLLLADVRRRLNDQVAFDRNVQRALLVDPRSPDAVLANAGRLADQGETARAVALIDESLARHPNVPELRWGRCLLLLRGADAHALLESSLQLVEYADAQKLGEFRVAGLLLEAIARQRMDPLDARALAAFCEAAQVETDVALGACEELAGGGGDRDLVTIARRCSDEAAPTPESVLVAAYIVMRGGDAEHALRTADAALARLRDQGAFATSRVALDLDVFAARAQLELGQGRAAAARLAAQARARPDLGGLWRMYADAAFASGSAEAMEQLRIDVAAAAEESKDQNLLELFAQIARAIEKALHPK